MSTSFTTAAGTCRSRRYHDPSLGRTTLRFCFCKKDETMLEADRRLDKLSCAR